MIQSSTVFAELMSNVSIIVSNNLKSLKMGSVHSSSEQRRSRRRFTIAETSIKPPSPKELFLFATEPKYKSKDAQMYHIYGITEFMRGSMKTVAITDLYNVCVDISFVKRNPADGIVYI